MRAVVVQLVLGVTYACDWDFVPSTKGPDGDPIDAEIASVQAGWKALTRAGYFASEPAFQVQVLTTNEPMKRVPFALINLLLMSGRTRCA